MAGFQQTLQTQPSGQAPVSQPSGTTAAANALSGVIEGASSFIQQQEAASYKQQQLNLQKAQMEQNTMEAERKQLRELQANDYAQQVANKWEGLSGSPIKRQEIIRQERTRLRKELDPTLLSAVADQFKKLTGEELYSSRAENLEEKNALQEQQAELDARNAQYIDSAFRYRDTNPQAAKMFTPEGQLKEGYTPEQAASVGSKMVAMQQGRLANLQAERDMATTEQEKINAESKITVAQVTPEITANIREFAQGLEGKDAQVAVTELDQQYNAMLLAIEGMSVNTKAKDALKTSLENTHNILRDNISGRQGVLSRGFVQEVDAAKVFQDAIDADPQTRAVFALNKAGIRPSEAGTKAAELGITKQIRQNPNNVEVPDGVVTNDDGSVTLDNGTKVPYQRIVTDTYIDNITLLKEPSTDPIPNLGGKSQADIIAERLVVGMNPVTKEQRDKFVGSNGLYLNMFKNVWSDKEAVKNFTPAVLNNEDVRESFQRNNSTAIARYAAGTMGSDRWIGEARDKVNITMDKGYPRLSLKDSVPRTRQGRPVSGSEVSSNLLQTDINNLNMLFRLQYEGAVNYGDVVQDDTLVEDLVSEQLRTLSSYLPSEDGELEGLTQSGR